MADDFGATGATTDTGLAYANGVGENEGGFDMGTDQAPTWSFGRSGRSATNVDLDSADAMGTIYSDFPQAVGDVNNENIVLSLPAFANDENKALNEKLIARNRELAKANSDTLEHQERISVMQEHLKNVRMELANAQKVLEAKSKEVKSEEHLGTLAERAVGRMKQDLSALESRGSLADQQLSSIQTSVFKGTEKLDAFKQAMNWKQEELEKWAAAARAKEDDALALDKYTRADDARVRELSRELERLAAAVIGKRKELEAEAMDSAAKQSEMDKLAEDFRAAHNERAELLSRWQESLEAITHRDDEIARLTERFADVKLAASARREQLKDGEKMLANLQAENTNMERSITVTNRQVSHTRDSVTDMTSRVGNLREGVDQLQFEVQGAAQELLQKRSENDNIKTSIEDKKALIVRAEEELAAIKIRRADTVAQAAAVEKALSDKEGYLAAEEAKVEKVQKEVALLRESQFRAQDTVGKLKETEEVLTGEIAGAKRTRKNLEDKLKELDAQATKQAEHVYAAEFQIQQMERKIGRARGDVSEEERVRLDARIAELKQELDEAQATEKQLVGETKSVKQSLQAAIRRQAELTRDLAAVQTSIDEALLQTRSGEEALKKAVREKEETLVSHDLLKLEVRRLRDALSDKTEGVYAAENRAAQVSLSIEVRKKEIAAHRAVQRAQAKLAEEERHRLALELADRTGKVSLMKTKFESLCAKGRGEEGGEPRSQAYYVLKAAQKREELQREGDELDTLIRKSEKEVRALASTLGYLTDRNEAFRRAFGSPEANDEVALVRALETQAKEAQDAVFRKKRELMAVSNAMADTGRRAEEAAVRASGLAAQLSALESQAHRAVAERDAQMGIVAQKEAAVAAARAKHRARRAARGGRGAPSQPGEPTPDELVFLAQGMREAASSVLYTLGQLARELPQLKQDLGPLLAQRNLRVPARPPSQAAGASSSSGLGTGSSSLAIATPSRGAAGAGGGGVGMPAPSPITVPAAAPVAGSALQAIRARPNSASTQGSARTSGSVGGGHRTSTPSGAAGGRAQGQGNGKGAGAKESQAGANLDFGVMGRPLASQPGVGNAGPGGKPPVPGKATGRTH